MQHRWILAALALTSASAVACGGGQTHTNNETQTQAPPPQRRAASSENECSANGGLTIEGQMGHLSRAQLTRVLDPATPQLVACYSQRLNDSPYIAGHVEMKIRIGEDGVPAWVIPTASTLGDRQTEQCMIERLSALRFDRPCNGATETTYPLDFQGGDDVRPAVEWDAARVNAAVTQHRAALTRCTSGHPGPYVITLYAAPHGTVATAGVSVPSAESSSVADCLLHEVMTWHVPDPGSWYAKTSIRLE